MDNSVGLYHANDGFLSWIYWKVLAELETAEVHWKLYSILALHRIGPAAHSRLPAHCAKLVQL